MKQESVKQPEIKIVGFTARTNMQTEMNPVTGKIGGLVARYWMQNAAAQIKNRKNPGITFAVYTDYASDEYGDYTYFLGEEVSEFEAIPEGMATLTIPAANYTKFTTPEGQMPLVVINAWQEIWKMSPQERGGDRAYVADFELYDQRAANPAKTSLDIYIGIK